MRRTWQNYQVCSLVAAAVAVSACGGGPLLAKQRWHEATREACYKINAFLQTEYPDEKWFKLHGIRADVYGNNVVISSTAFEASDPMKVRGESLLSSQNCFAFMDDLFRKLADVGSIEEDLPHIDHVVMAFYDEVVPILRTDRFYRAMTGVALHELSSQPDPSASAIRQSYTESEDLNALVKHVSTERYYERDFKSRGRDKPVISPK